ncbi:MAG: SDR family oxidoreductase [Verrucomicrobia bacterium]|nr:SDR family oxidoreductase [Verrucomicrobiota bacterium]
MKPKCLITGASGFLGSAIAERLRKDMTVIGCGHQTAIDGHRCDLRDPSAVHDLVSRVAPDVVVHAAAYKDPDFCEANPDEARRLNVGSTHHLCDSLPSRTVIIFISSDYVFDGRTPPYTEGSTRGAVNLYGETKIASEDIIAQRPNALSLRVPVLVGGGATLETSGYIGQLIACVRDKTPVTQDHYHVRYPTWTHDVADAIAFLIGQGVVGVIQYSGTEGSTRYEGALETARRLGESSDHISPSEGSIPRGAPRPHNSALSTRKIQGLGYSRFTPFAQVIRGVADAFPG